MRNVEYRKTHNKEKGIKHFHIKQLSETKECVTLVNKSFVYQASIADDSTSGIQDPQMFVKKQIDTKNQIEKFTFEVKGAFLITHDRRQVKIKFNHCLNIEIRWKTKIFSPKKSAVLT